MSHAIHSTQGLLIDDRPYGEAGRILYVLTPEHGILTFLAQGVREQKSKLRGLLSLGTLATFEFVEGREVKRLTTILPTKRFAKIFEKVESRNVFSRVVNFVERVVLGEQENHELYQRFLDGLDVLENYVPSVNANFQNIEIAIIINILHALGYWRGDEYVGYDNDVFVLITSNKDNLVKEINIAIESTHL